MKTITKEIQLFSLVAVSFISLCSCSGSGSQCSGKQVTCPSFNDNLSLQWIPYKQSQQLIFNSSTATSDTFNISDAALSSSYQASVTAGQPFCIAEADFKTTSNDMNAQPILEVDLNISRNQFNNTEKNQSFIRIKGGFFQGAGFSDTGLIKSYDYSLSHFYNTAIVGNKTFSNVQEVYIDTSRMVLKSSDVYRFWVAKNQGIVGYEEYHGNLWVKQ